MIFGKTTLDKFSNGVLRKWTDIKGIINILEDMIGASRRMHVESLIRKIWKNGKCDKRKIKENLGGDMKDNIMIRNLTHKHAQDRHKWRHH